MNQPIFPITMPRWGIEMLRGTVVQWHVGPGQAVKKGDSLLDVETDKIVNSVEAPVAGVLRIIVTAKGDTAEAGALIAVIAAAAVSNEAVSAFVRDFRSGKPQAPGAIATATGTPAGSVSPIARRLAERLGIDIANVKGSGIQGRVSKEDVEAYAAAHTAGHTVVARPVASAGAAATATATATETSAEPPASRETMTATRATIARRLLESTQGIPHYRLEIDVDFNALFELRATHDLASVRPSVNDFVVRATALALMKHPLLNAQLIGDELLKFPHADIGIAVVTDKGLVTPVLRRAELKAPAQIAIEIRELAQRARRGTLTREEISGGGFTISNLGMYGVDRFDAIINPPQVAILALAAAADRAVARDGMVVVRKVATLTLSADHRVIDGADGAQFLATLRQLIEAPHSLS